MPNEMEGFEASPYGGGYYVPQPGLGTKLEGAFSTAFGSLFGCGASMFTLILVIVILLVALWLLAKSHLSFLKEMAGTLAALKEAVNAKRD